MRLFNFKKKDLIPESFHSNSEVIGIYTIPNHKDVKLIELVITEQINDFNPGQITQQIKNKNKLNWQTIYDEKYLNLDGNKIIGDDFVKPSGLEKFRLIFFFHFLDINAPLISQYGLIKLKPETDLPERLCNMINYEPEE